MKKTQRLSLLLSIIWYSLVTQGQTIVHYPTVMRNKEPLLYGSVTAQRPNGNWIFRLAVSTADDSTTYYYPANRLSGYTDSKHQSHSPSFAHSHVPLFQTSESEAGYR